MFSKILISGKIETVTGLHIGTGGDYSAIGTADSPVIRDAVSGLPVIPGSSLKGKLRYLLSKKYNEKPIKKHEDDNPRILNLFGSCEKASRLVFFDMTMSNDDELKKMGIYNPTEIKFENTINRMTSVANPRQIERVIRNCKFDMNIIYNCYDECTAEDVKNDICLLADGMKLLQYDYLGGNGSRGYGKIKFTGLSAEVVVGDENGGLDEIIKECNLILEEVHADEI